VGLKKRLIACLVVKNGVVVQSIGFSRYLPVGRVDVAVEFLNSWGVDEIVMLDIDATHSGRGPDTKLVSQASQRGLVPLTVGGGIRSVDDMRQVLRSGADKIAINSAAIRDASLVSEGARVFGNQCIVVSIDAKLDSEGDYEVYSPSGRAPTQLDPFEHARRVEELGAGEVLLNSVDRDGSQAGYDLKLIGKMTEAVNIPVIVCGGVGHPRHFVEGFRAGNVSAVAAANFFHFSEHSVTTAKSYLAESGTDIRLDTYADYREHKFDSRGRVSKRPDGELAELVFEYIPKEVI
jgi:cyclase